MQNILIYGGIVINIIGAILLACFAIKAQRAYDATGRFDRRRDEIKAQWGHRRMIAWGTILCGSIIVVIGCMM